MDQAPAPLTLEEHRELARELRLTSSRLRELCALITGLYGSDSRAAFTFARAVESVERMRAEMQTQAVLDWPEAIKEHIYGELR